METLPLRSGAKMPILGLGTWHHGPKGEMKGGVETAIRLGFRHIDCAHIYLNEKEVGEALKEVMGEKSNKLVDRSDLFVATKLWGIEHEPHRVEEACRRQMSLLGLDYLDLYYIHWPTPFVYGEGNVPQNADGSVKYGSTHYKDTWRAMERLVEMGLVRDIGLSNFNTQQIDDILSDCKIAPSVLQVECNPRFTNSLLREFCFDRNIQVVGFSSFGSPDLPWGRRDLPHILVDPVLRGIADEHGKTTAQVVLRWKVQNRVGAIPKSIIARELEENLQIFDFSLSDEEVKKIDGLNQGIRKILPLVTLSNGEVVPRDAKDEFFPFRDEL